MLPPAERQTLIVAMIRIQASEAGMRTFQPSLINWSQRIRGNEARSQMNPNWKMATLVRNHSSGHHPRNNSAREGGGAIFYVVDSGWGTLTLNRSHLHGNPSGQFQTFPGIYDNIDGHDGPPVMIDSTDS